MAYEQKAPQPPKVANVEGDPNEMPPLTPDLIRGISTGKPWQHRFDELLDLEAGWVDGEQGDWIRLEALLVSQRIQDECLENSWRLPEIVPCEDGGVYLEWTRDQRISAAEVYIGENKEGHLDVLVDLFDWDRSDDRTWEVDKAGFQEVMTFVSNVAP